MPRRTKELSALEVKRLSAPGRHAVGTVPGLYLWVRESGSKSWVLRVVVGGRRTDIGLGAYPAVPLAQAIQKARAKRAEIEAGADPVADKRSEQSGRCGSKTFRELALEYIDLHRAAWKNTKHAQQWKNTLTQYAFPAIGDMPADAIDVPHVLAVLRPHWLDKTETMTRLRSRIERVLAWAMAAGHRERGFNPASWRGNLDAALPRPSKVMNRQHHAAMRWQDVPAFMRQLVNIEGTSARCLAFVILTACRSGEARGATWDEIDWDNRVWNIPAQRMKSGRPHRVPLSDAAIELLRALPRIEGESLVFPGARPGRPLSDMSLSMLVRRHVPGVTVHGFRSAFRDWAAENTNHPREVCEMALAHAVASGTEAAYFRSDLFQRRRALMQDWAEFVMRKPSAI